ncbi:MAG: ribonuclease H [uncultured bacterium]|nr:MAG: ribonuclease H [uncultured bacterium]KKP67990.1 MAG: Ribonuclease H [Candidatus Moranbacteria bacterium GW2011_GWE1_35_17]KKP72139.1 MAG: Ribonuclease H [Candidatus Moranbacteria bacterium GW2011_GWE2_35_164]KKP83977.1 MAG: Ribonuclease H [Candidatus Moranbacteria bacterium GW2011_GWF2_35_54]KKP84164.1 MAG: Ribonuclease H [Candidatus Moranbacteria bacterium GW2011_GWF1_35_5]
MENKIVIYTDGGSRGNPGPAGIGVWIKTLDKKYGECIGIKTNNDAEYEALIFGLKKVKALLGKTKAKQFEIECYADSELMVKQLNHEYKLKEERIQKYFIEIWNLMLDFKEVKFNHVMREKNKVADEMVNAALDGKCKQTSLL